MQDLVIQSTREQLTTHMTRLVEAAQWRQGEVVFTRPCVSPAYNGVWPDDGMWPYMALPELASTTEWNGLLHWLTEAIVDLPCVPDRVEFDGLAVMSPGNAGAAPLSLGMPLHLPSAWTRYLQYAASFGCDIPRKRDWARIIRRSFDLVPYSRDLVYSDPQTRMVGFGFHDSIRLTGMELMSSLITYRGLQRAAAFFADVIDDGVREGWRQRAEALRANLYRLYDVEAGGFVGGSREGRMVSVWGSGLAYSLATQQQRVGIINYLLKHRESIFLRGCTRQTAAPGGWSGQAGGYQDSGFWAVGTGFVLPALADGAPDFAEELARELLANIESLDYAEWLDPQGGPRGARHFLASVAMPLLALRSLSEGRPLIEYF